MSLCLARRQSSIMMMSGRNHRRNQPERMMRRSSLLSSPATIKRYDRKILVPRNKQSACCCLIYELASLGRHRQVRPARLKNASLITKFADVTIALCDKPPTVGIICSPTTQNHISEIEMPSTSRKNPFVTRGSTAGRYFFVIFDIITIVWPTLDEDKT